MTDDEIDTLVTYLVAESQERQGGCCSGPEWRAHLCPYHEGYEDGLMMAIERLAPEAP